MDYITLAEAKVWLGIDSGDATKDAILTPLITTVSEAIDGFCEVAFTPTVVTNEAHDARRQDIIVPKHWPLVSVQAVRYAVETNGTGGVTIDPTGYSIDDVEIRLKFMVAPLQRAYFGLDYTHGFAAPPERVKLATKIGVEGYYRHRARQAVGITSKAKEGESINFKAAWDTQAGLPIECISLLKQFRMLEFPGGLETATRNW